MRVRAVVFAVVFVCLAAQGAYAQPAAQAAGPTRIKIAAGTVSADDTRAGLLGAWEPDADLGLPAGSNHMIFLADGLYINPFRNVALIGFWTATADVLTSTPFDIRQLDTGATSPDLKEVFKQISWDQPTVTKLKWIAPDRFQENGSQEAKRRAQPVHDITKVHRAVVANLLLGSWTTPRGATIVFEPDGTFHEQIARGVVAAPYAAAQRPAGGTYDVDGAGLLLRTNTEVNAASRAARLLQTGAQAPSRLRWTNRGIVTVDGEQWTRQIAPSAPPAGGRGWLGVATTTNGVPILSIVPNSPAASAGMRVGDVILGLYGVEVQQAEAFRAAIAAKKPGDRVELTVSRDGTTSELTVTLASGANGTGSLGVGLALGGVIVTGVQAGSPAERAGLRVGDQIESVNGRVIQDGAELVRAMQALAPGTDATLTIVRAGARIERRVTIGRLPQ